MRKRYMKQGLWRAILTPYEYYTKFEIRSFTYSDGWETDCEGFAKFDGCLNFQSKECAVHTCSPDQTIDFGMLLARIQQFATRD